MVWVSMRLFSPSSEVNQILKTLKLNKRNIPKEHHSKYQMSEDSVKEREANTHHGCVKIVRFFFISVP